MGGGAQYSVLFLVFVGVVVEVKVEGEVTDGCDLFKGRWVVDESYPLYEPATCPFIEREFRCETNGRPDLIYTHYRWQPLACKLLRLSSISLSIHSLLPFSSSLLFSNKITLCLCTSVFLLFSWALTIMVSKLPEWPDSMSMSTSVKLERDYMIMHNIYLLFYLRWYKKYYKKELYQNILL